MEVDTLMTGVVLELYQWETILNRIINPEASININI